MIGFIIEGIIIACLAGFSVYIYKKLMKAFNLITKLTVELINKDKKIDNIDQSTGADIFKLRKEFDAFKSEYGDAAIEEMREHAKREKAWAEGIDSIMSYGAALQGRGDST